MAAKVQYLKIFSIYLLLSWLGLPAPAQDGIQPLPQLIPYYHYGKAGPRFGYAAPGAMRIFPGYFSSVFPEQEGVAITVTERADQSEYFGAVDTALHEIIPQKFAYIGLFSNGLAPAALPGQKRGYIDRSGNWVIPPQWEDAGEFNGNYALVGHAEKFGLIDRKGRLVLPMRYDEFYWPDKSWASHDYAIVRIKERGWGMVSLKLQRETVPCTWDEVKFEYAEGLLPVRKGKKWGFVDSTGWLAIPCIYDNANGYYEGLAPAVKYGKSGYINSTGSNLIPFEYDFASRFSEAIAVAYRRDEGKWYWLDLTGKVMRSFPSSEYTAFGDFHEGRVRFRKRMPDGNFLWGYMDANGEEVIAPQFSDCHDFSEGRAIVSGNTPYDNVLWGLIDPFGKKLSPIKYSQLYPVAGFEGILWYCEKGMSLMSTPMIDRNGVEYFSKRAE